MRLSHRHRFIWLSLPKSGSTSIRQALDPFSDVRSGPAGHFWHHAKYRDVVVGFAERGWDLDGYVVLICDRNPWRRVCSLWKYARMTVDLKAFWNPGYDASLPRLPFPDFLDADRTWAMLKRSHRLAVYIEGAPAEHTRVYDIDTGLDHLLRDLQGLTGTALAEIARRNVSRYGETDAAAFAAAFADPGTDRRMRTVFADSIARFGYENPFAAQVGPVATQAGARP